MSAYTTKCMKFVCSCTQHTGEVDSAVWGSNLFINRLKQRRLSSLEAEPNLPAERCQSCSSSGHLIQSAECLHEKIVTERGRQ